MDLLQHTSITITEYRNILKAIKDRFEIDFNEYTLVFLKRRIESFMYAYRYASAESLINHIARDDDFIHTFLREILVESTEMFRDPSFWRYLRDFVIPRLVSENKSVRIVLPHCVSGDELYSLCILLAENNWTHFTEIFAATADPHFENNIRKGVFAIHKYEVSAENYLRYHGKFDFSKYCQIRNDVAIRDNSLVQQVNFIKYNGQFSFLPENIHLIIYRNQLIYFTQTLHDRVLKTFYEKLSRNGCLAIGVREQLGIISQQLYRVVNESERIYVKN
ncbi:MAG: hypothetical protein N2662_08050 [Bacteroidales bacterium]|nr:hypothetical protein [Bacteroidales bacterium]